MLPLIIEDFAIAMPRRAPPPLCYYILLPRTEERAREALMLIRYFAMLRFYDVYDACRCR